MPLFPTLPLQWLPLLQSYLEDKPFLEHCSIYSMILLPSLGGKELYITALLGLCAPRALPGLEGRKELKRPPLRCPEVWKHFKVVLP